MGNVEMSKNEIKTFDQTKVENVKEIENIEIDSAITNINVSVSNSTTEEIEARFHGNVSVVKSGEIFFEVSKENNKIKILVKPTGTYNKLNLDLDIVLPKKIFNELSIKSYTSLSINLNEGVLANYIRVYCECSKLTSKAIFESAKFFNEGGDVEVYTYANDDIFLNVSTNVGDISITLNNINYINLHANNTSRILNKKKQIQNGYCADIKVSTIIGKIDIK